MQARAGFATVEDSTDGHAALYCSNDLSKPSSAECPAKLDQLNTFGQERARCIRGGRHTRHTNAHKGACLTPNRIGSRLGSSIAKRVDKAPLLH